jgi:hypothetical protein
MTAQENEEFLKPQSRISRRSKIRQSPLFLLPFFDFFDFVVFSSHNTARSTKSAAVFSYNDRKF